MSDFKVTTGDLHDLANHLAGLIRSLTDATGNVHGEGPGVAGAPRLESAIAGFVADWSAGVEELQSTLDKLSSRLGAAATTYEASENDISGHLDGVAAHLLGR